MSLSGRGRLEGVFGCHGRAGTRGRGKRSRTPFAFPESNRERCPVPVFQPTRLARRCPRARDANVTGVGCVSRFHAASTSAVLQPLETSALRKRARR